MCKTRQPPPEIETVIMCSTPVEISNGLSAEHLDTEMVFDLLPEWLDLETLDFDFGEDDMQGLPISPLSTKGRRHREESSAFAKDCPCQKKLRTGESKLFGDVSDLLDVAIEDGEIMGEDKFSADDEIDIDSVFAEKENDFIPSDDVFSFAEKENDFSPVNFSTTDDEIDVDNLLLALENDAEVAENAVEEIAVCTPVISNEVDHPSISRIPLPSKKWVGHSVARSSPSKKKKEAEKMRVFHKIDVKKVYVEERTLSTAQKKSHKLWAINRKRCLTGFKGFKCPAKSKAAKIKVRNNGRFEHRFY
jgi:hypothetical protein